MKRKAYPVIVFLDRSDDAELLKYTTIETEDGTEMTHTSHIQGKSRQQLSTTKAYTHLTNFASKMKANDNTFTRSNKRNEV